VRQEGVPEGFQLFVLVTLDLAALRHFSALCPERFEPEQ
jgi:hypothetical protein